MAGDTNIALTDDQACQERLHDLGVGFTPLSAIQDGACGIPAPLEVRRLSATIALSAPATMNCETAEGLSRWAMGVVAPAVRDHLHADLTAVTEERRARAGTAFAAALLVLIAVPGVQRWRRDHETRSALDRTFAARLETLPRHSIVFIKYSPRLVQHMSVVFNYPDLNAAPVWVVHDLGARNDELRRLAPDRASFDFEEDQLVSRRR